MKIILLISLAVAFVTVSQASMNDVKCTVNELGIRWPNYSSMNKNEYFVCDGINGKKVMMTCNEGDMFSFVMQSCTGPNHFIPAPPSNKLPTDDHFVVKPEVVAEPAAAETIKHEAPMPSKKAPVLPSKKSPPAPVGVAKKKAPQIPKPLKH